MPYESTATPDYMVGFGSGALRSLQRYTAATNAAYLLPCLRPGLRVLDFGCGPGSISVGLARAVAPGELHGVDMEASQIELAKSAARDHGQDNAIFQVGDVTDLPFEDGFFDVAHCHNVLMHVPDTRAALAEVLRVLKPGGVVGCREMIYGSSFTRPDLDGGRRMWDVQEDLLTAADGHPQMGRNLKNAMLEAGFVNVRASASFDMYSSPEDVEFAHNLLMEWLLSPEITEAAIQYGAATRQLCGDIRVALERWRVHPGAIIGVAFGEAVAGKPQA